MGWFRKCGFGLNHQAHVLCIVWLMLVRYIEDTMHVRISYQIIGIRETIYHSISDVERVPPSPPIEPKTRMSAIVFVPQPIITINPFLYPATLPVETLSNIVCMNYSDVIMVACCISPRAV